uniref:Si:dkey-30c15.13 n=1 Tax=Steinernema glaseri TaxID=37863 RepID=A0A1I7YJ68_9BILA
MPEITMTLRDFTMKLTLRTIVSAASVLNIDFTMKVTLRTIVSAASALNIIFSVCQIALTCSIFDFVVMNGMFYAMPNKNILIPTKWSYFSYSFSMVNMLLCLWSLHRISDNSSLGYEQLVKWQRMRQVAVSIWHLLCLTASAGAALYLCIQFSILAQSVGVYAENSEPKAFQDAANWYYVRLCAQSVLFGCSAFLSLISFCVQNNCSEFQRKDEKHSCSYPRTQC